MNIIFLDIDGVLYPCFQRHVQPMQAACYRKELQKRRICTEGISDWDVRNVCAFDKEAIARLRLLCEQCNAWIVLESSWKYVRSLEQMKRLFAIWELDRYVIDITDNLDMIYKEPSIQRYLAAHPGVDRYVILDDVSMKKSFPYNDVITPDVLDEESFQKAMHILKGKQRKKG